MLENQFKYGYVVGLLVSSLGDGGDDGRYPDVIASNTKVTFTRTRGQYKKPLESAVNGVKSMLVNHQVVKAGITPDGFITGDIDEARGLALPYANPGLWLVTGLYKVSLGGFMPDFEIEVTEEHTQESPLDIADYISYVAPAKTPVQTVSIPRGSDGQLMQWDSGEIVWKDAEVLAGPANTLTIGTVTSADTPSATITGTPPNQVLSLVLPKGKDGVDSFGLGEAPEPGLWAVGMTWRGGKIDPSVVDKVNTLLTDTEEIRNNLNELSSSTLTLGVGEAPSPGLWAVGVTWRGARVGSTTETTPAPATTTPARTASGPRLVAFGDSLTALPGIIRGGGQDTPSTSYPAQLASMLGVTVTNRGWSGRNATTIAINGGVTPAALRAAVTIPAGTDPVTVSTTGADAWGSATYTRSVHVAGVSGTLKLANGVETFTRAVAGTAVEAPLDAPVWADFADDGAALLVGIGRNSVGTASLPPGESLGVIMSRVSDFVAAASRGVDAPRLLILDVPPYDNQGTGTSGRVPLDALNNALAARWPEWHVTPYKYLRTRQAFEDAGLAPTAQDEADMAKDITPVTFRGDTVHLTTEGNKAVARYIAAALRERRWYA